MKTFSSVLLPPSPFGNGQFRVAFPETWSRGPRTILMCAIRFDPIVTLLCIPLKICMCPYFLCTLTFAFTAALSSGDRANYTRVCELFASSLVVAAT